MCDFDPYAYIYCKEEEEALGEVQTSLTKADHYSHIAQCKNVGLNGERLTLKVLDHYLHHHLDMLQLLWCFSLIYSSLNTQITTKI